MVITDRRALLEFTPDLARVLGEFLATPHAGAGLSPFSMHGRSEAEEPVLSEDVAHHLCGPQASMPRRFATLGRIFAPVREDGELMPEGENRRLKLKA